MYVVHRSMQYAITYMHLLSVFTKNKIDAHMFYEDHSTNEATIAKGGSKGAKTR